MQMKDHIERVYIYKTGYKLTNITHKIMVIQSGKINLLIELNNKHQLWQDLKNYQSHN
jgi:hypothetical protein